jgi:O-antigen ligase/polysaccharide polymerase Wzy-like membrane protein
MIASTARKGEEASDVVSLQNRTATSAESEGSFAFVCLLFLTFIIYVAPQAIFPFLEPLRLAFVSAVLGIGAYILTVFRGHPVTIMSQEIKLVFWFMALAIVSIPLSGWPGGSFTFFTDVFSKSIIVFFLVANLLTSKDRLRKFFWVFALFSAFNAYNGIHRYSIGEVYDSRGGARGSYSGVAGDPNDLALSVTMALPFVWYLFESNKSTFQRWISGGICVVLLCGVVLTYSRGGFLSLLALFLWFVYGKVKEGKTGVMVTAVLAFVVMLTLAPGSYSNRILSIVDASEDATGSSTSRWDGMVEAAKIAVAHPLGVGLKMHNILMGGHMIGVHNAFLEVAADLGIVGGVLFVMIVWKLFVSMGRISRDRRPVNDELPRMAEAAQASLVAFAVGGFFLAQAYTFPVYYLMGIAVAIQELAGRQMPLSERGCSKRNADGQELVRESQVV